MFWESAEPLEVRCGAACDPERARQWHSTVVREWGECGRVAMENDEVLGFIKYAPPAYLPQAMNFPGHVPAGRSVLIACLHIRDDARRHGLGTLLLRAALRDLAMRGERTVFAYAGETTADMTDTPVIGVEFLIRNGFRVASPHPAYPLLRLDLKSLAMWTENLEAVLDSLRIPLRRPARVPSPTVESRGAKE
ncbi:MAG: GNAT family N-acetyltransferase [Coriobacteriia bacterium]|nr:GNAT family N-acetyltransferase [Coriobacteriia bacterium]